MMNEKDEAFINYYAKWIKEANIDGLKHGDMVDGIELLKRNIFDSINYAKCPICKQEDVCVYRLDNNIICCIDCEEKLIDKVVSD